MRWIKILEDRWEAEDGLHLATASNYGGQGFRAQVSAKPLQAHMFEEQPATAIPGMYSWADDLESALRQVIRQFDHEAILPSNYDR